MTTAPPAPQARPNPAEPPAAAPRHGGTGLPTITTPPTPKRPDSTQPAPSPFQQAAIAHHEHRIGELEARAAAMENAAPTPRRITTPAPASNPEKQGAEKPKRPFVDRFGPKVALAAAVGLTASGEYQLAHLVGFPGIIAALLPTAIDVYVIQAMRRHRDVAAALILMVATNALYHLAAAGLFGVTPHPGAGHTTYTAKWWLIVAVAAVAPFIVWRIHRITETRTARKYEPAPQVLKTEKAPEPANLAPGEPRQVPQPEQNPAAPEVHEPSPTPPTTPVREPRTTPTKQVREPETPREPKAPRTSKPNTGTANLGDRAATKRTQIDQVLNLIRELGYDAVTLPVVRERTGMTKTTAYHRLTDARAEWNQRAAS